MKTIGIIGGLGPESTVDYYKNLIKAFRKATGGDRNPDIVIVSLDIVEVLDLVAHRDFQSLTDLLSLAVTRLAAAGSQLAAIASNTPHVVFEELRRSSPIELVSIVEATCECVRRRSFARPLLTGTRFTMTEEFYAREARRQGIELLYPEARDVELFHDVIFPELEDGIIVPEKKARYIAMVNRYIEREGVDAIILGCTELPLMIGEGDVPVPLLNTSAIHVDAIVRRMLQEESILTKS